MPNPQSEIEEVTKDFEILYPQFNTSNLNRISIIRFGDPYVAPGTCAVCVSTLSPEKYFVDLGITVDDIGALYICNLCMASTLEAMKAITVDNPQFVKLFNGYTNAVAEVGRLRLELKKTEDKVRNGVIVDLRNYLGSRIGHSPGSITMENVQKSTVEVTEPVNSGADSSQRGSKSNGSTNRSNDEQRSTDIFDLADLEKLDFDTFSI